MGILGGSPSFLNASSVPAFTLLAFCDLCCIQFSACILLACGALPEMTEVQTSSTWSLQLCHVWPSQWLHEYRTVVASNTVKSGTEKCENLYNLYRFAVVWLCKHLYIFYMFLLFKPYGDFFPPVSTLVLYYSLPNLS